MKYFEGEPSTGPLAGTTIPAETLLYRYRVVESLMFAGVPLAKSNYLRTLLEREGHNLTSAAHLGQDYVPQISQREEHLVKKEISGEYIGVIFDGTTRLGEAVNIITRHISEDFRIILRLVDFTTMKVHMNGLQLFAHLVHVLSTRLQIDVKRIVVLARDSCATNGVAVTSFIGLAVNALNMLCFPHTLHNSGKEIDVPVLNRFMTPWLTNVHNNSAAKLKWQSILGCAMAKFSTVRWWSRFECMREISVNFSQLPDFLQYLEDNDIGDATTKTMRSIVMDEGDALQLELAAVLSLQRVERATYRLEGDGLEILLVHETIEPLRAFGRSLGKDASDLPSVSALLRAKCVIAQGTCIREYYGAPHNKWYTGTVTRLPVLPARGVQAIPTYQVTYIDKSKIESDEIELRNTIDVLKFPEWDKAVASVQGCFKYLEKRLTNDCQTPYHCAAAYEVCRVTQLFDPSYAAVHLTAAYVDELCAAIPMLTDRAQGLKVELSTYSVLAKAAPNLDKGDVHAFTEGVLLFWRVKGLELPAWRAAARIVFAIPPTSAASERVFALLKAMFGADQIASLSDYIQGALMLRYNKRVVG